MKRRSFLQFIGLAPAAPAAAAASSALKDFETKAAALSVHEAPLYTTTETFKFDPSDMGSATYFDGFSATQIDEVYFRQSVRRQGERK